MKLKATSLASLLVTAGFVATSSASTLLLSDNFNDDPNGNSWSFNDNLASTQGGTLAVTTYSVQGNAWTAQHSNGGHLLVATSTDGNGNGSVSLNNNFATQANAANQALQISFNIVEVSNYALSGNPDNDRWVQFNVGNAQNLDVANVGVGYGIIFRVSGVTGIPGGTWAPNDLVTITLTDTAGTGSAFNGNGSKAIVSVGATNYGTFTLAQQTDAYLTFSAFNYGNDQFGLGTFDNLSVSLVPEPSAALLGGLGLLALLRRRRG